MRWGVQHRSRSTRTCAAQLAASLLILCAASGGWAHAGHRPNQIGMLGVWDRVKPALERAGRETEIGVRQLTIEELLGEHGATLLAGFDVLCVLNLPPEQVRPLIALLRRARALNRHLRVLALDERAWQVGLRKAGLLHRDAHLTPYWRAAGHTNLSRMLRYIAVTYLGAHGATEPPAMLPASGYFHPAAAEVVPDLAHYRALPGWHAGAPVVALVMQRSFWITGDTRVLKAEMKALQAQGFNVIALFGDSGAEVRARLRAVKPVLIVEDRHGSMWQGDGGTPLLRELDVPYLRPISMLAYTEAQWRADPRGLHPRDVGNFMTLQEMKGTLDPIIVGALRRDVHGFKVHVPLPRRIARFAERAAAWYRLAKKPNRDKHIVIIYYNKSLGKDDLLRGSPTGAFLDGPASLVRFLPRLAARGFQLKGAPTTARALLDVVRKRGRNLGPWAQGELERLANSGGAVLIPVARLQRWLKTKLNAEQRASLTRYFGPPPGRLMVVKRNGVRNVVLPMVRLGNVLLAPQPERGENQDSKLLHSRDVPPPYNYLAFYWWLQDDLHADAVLHWGTHGSLELLPGKEAGLTGEDWSDLCTGALPIINPWIMDNLGESTLSRRRSYAALVDHLVPPVGSAGLSDGLRGLHDDIDKFGTLPVGVLRRAFRDRITAATHTTRIDETLKIKGLPKRRLTDPEIVRVADYLHEVYNATTPTSLHVLGLLPATDKLAPWLATMLGARLRRRLGANRPGPAGERAGDKRKRLGKLAERLVRRAVLGDEVPPPALRRDVARGRVLLDGLRRVGDEITNLIHALEGGYVPPGAGPDPVRNAASLPSGRNLYTLNPEEIPTRASWQVGQALVAELLKRKHPKKVGIDLNGMNTMRDFGVMEAQIFALIGVRPIWDSRNLVVDVAVIPRAELGRPRVDVFVAMGGQYKENFPTRVKLIDKAIRKVAALSEADNQVHTGTEQQRARLLKRGFSARRAKQLAAARIFGGKPGNLGGTNILHLIPRSGVWRHDDEIARVYLDTMGFVFTAGIWGKKVDGLYADAIVGTDTLLRVWASNMTSQLSNHHAYEYLGGLSLAVKYLTGVEAEAFIADVRDPNGARLRDFEEVLATNLRTELLSRKWIVGMKEHGYAGAGMMAELVKNTFGWDVTRSQSISDGVWRDIYEIYVQDRYQLDLAAWFERDNPHAFQAIAATLLEADRKGYWRATEAQRRTLARRYATSVARHGVSAGLITGGNQALANHVKQQLTAPGDAALSRRFEATMARSAQAPKGSAPQVHGAKLVDTTAPRQPKAADAKQRSSESAVSPATELMLLFSLLGLLAALGFLRRSGTAR